MSNKILSVEKIRELMKAGTSMEWGTDLLFSFGEYAQEALKILVEHFLGEFVIDYSGSVEQWNSEAVYEILRQYPEGKLCTVPKSKKEKI